MQDSDDHQRSRSISTIGRRVIEFGPALDRTSEPRLKRWLLLDGDRRLVSAMLVGSVFCTLLVLSQLWPIEMRVLLDETTMIQTLFDTLLAGTILLVSIVVSINSVVLSQELVSLGDQHERVETTMEFRKSIEELSDENVSPSEPGRFIHIMLIAIQRQAEALVEAAGDNPDHDLGADLERFVDGIQTDVDEVNQTLQGVQSGTSDELLAGLNYSCSQQINAARRLQIAYEDTLSDREHAAIDRLVDTLTYFTTGREYFKTLYYKQEFANLSTALLYVSLPVIVFISYVLLALDTGLFPEVSLAGISPLVVFVSFAYAVALAPYVVLTSYVIRSATVSKRTLAAGPFVVDPRKEVEQIGTDGD